MPRLLILLTLPPDIRNHYETRLRRRFPNLEIDVVDHHSKAAPLAPQADILLTFGAMTSAEMFAKATRLKWVQALGTGVDGVIDQPALASDAIVTNIRGIHGAPVSEAIVTGMLALSRDLPRSLRAQDQHHWTRWPPRLLDNKTVGIYGVGLIAEALAPRCKAFGMTVWGYSTTSRDVSGIDRMLPRSDLVSSAAQLDYLVLLVPFSEETRHSIDRQVFTAMKPTAYFINFARGGVVNEDDMIDALNSGTIAGAAIDVFQTEPLPAGSPIWSAKNIIVTPHLGGFSDVYADLALETIEHNMECWLRGDVSSMRNVVRR